jgi:outer membrane immunogenic protein
MKKIILALAILGMFQTTVAQKKKKTTVKKAVTTTKAATPKTSTSKTIAPTKTTSTASQTSTKSIATGNNQEGILQLNAGIGVSGWGTPVYVGVDYGVTEEITIGAEGSYRSYNESYYGSNYGSSIIGLGANGNYHFQKLLKIPSNWDVYAGLGLNYYIWKYKDSAYTGSNNSGISLGAQLGGRYFFTDKFGVNLELAGASATTGAKIGITYRLK